jgi:hypothetical protein
MWEGGHLSKLNEERLSNPSYAKYRSDDESMIDEVATFEDDYVERMFP